MSEQIAEVSDKDLAVKVRKSVPLTKASANLSKAILLVGGFGENRYLYDRLVKCHAHDGIQVMQVNGAFVFFYFYLLYSRLTLKLVQMVLDLPWSNVVGPGTFRPDIRHQ